MLELDSSRSHCSVESRLGRSSCRINWMLDASRSVTLTKERRRRCSQNKLCNWVTTVRLILRLAAKRYHMMTNRAHRVGTHIKGNLTSIENDLYRASITLTLGNQVECINAETQIVRSERLELRTELEVGRETKIPCGGNRWIQLRVDN